MLPPGRLSNRASSGSHRSFRISDQTGTLFAAVRGSTFRAKGGPSPGGDEARIGAR
jgi:hypothetical protein